ncbi:MAG: hypothetical protein J1F17_02240 [Oscillospiraceae bacterium]|nr:hypothetical protein [Oscillospiraceae bacterium]
MGINQVAERFQLLSGVDDGKLQKWMPLISESASYVKSLLKPDVKEEKYGDLLSSAAGTYAYYKWSLYSNSGDIKQFKAGDITVTENSGNNNQNSLVLWKQSLDEIAHLTKNNSFFFEGVLA